MLRMKIGIRNRVEVKSRMTTMTGIGEGGFINGVRIDGVRTMFKSRMRTIGVRVKIRIRTGIRFSVRTRIKIVFRTSVRSRFKVRVRSRMRSRY